MVTSASEHFGVEGYRDGYKLACLGMYCSASVRLSYLRMIWTSVSEANGMRFSTAFVEYHNTLRSLILRICSPSSSLTELNSSHCRVHPHRPPRRPWFPTFQYRTCCFPCHEAFFLLASAGRIVLESDGASSVYARDKGHSICETRAYLRKALETEWANEVYQEESRRLEQVVGMDPYLEHGRPVVTKCSACGPPLEDGMTRMRRRLDRIR
jgi:hypothetical protein